MGLPKTATTTLQIHLFHELHQEGKVNFLGRYLAPEYDDFYFKIYDIIKAVRDQSDEEFEKNLQQYIKQANSYIQENTLNIISEEGIAISYKKNNFSLDINKNLKRIRKIFSEHTIEVLLSIRKQDKIIHSFFVEVYPTIFFSNDLINTLDKYIQDGLETKESGNFYMYYYDMLVNQCENLFGVDSCKVLVFEDMKQNRVRYIKTLSNALNISIKEVQKH